MNLTRLDDGTCALCGGRDLFGDVKAFQDKFDLPTYPGTPPGIPEEDVLTFRTRFMVEELQEFRDACARSDLCGAADALADLVYVALGTAHLMGLPFNEIWREVQRANMTKVRAESKDDPRSKRGHWYDVVKPEGFAPPDHSDAIVAAAGAHR